MARILCLSNSDIDLVRMKGPHSLVLFRIAPILPSRHSAATHESVYDRLANAVDLSAIDIVFAEFVESLPLVYLMRRRGFCKPAVFVPHTNPYPVDILLYFLALKCVACDGDVVVCGSQFAASAYQRLVGIPAVPVGTFGISSDFQKRPQSRCRADLRLPAKDMIAVYTGRFARDKGIRALLDGWDAWKSSGNRGQLVISSSHIEPDYFNALAPRLRDVVFYYRLSREDLVSLYNAADVFVSGATSIFETYGKSHMEAIACGTPAVVPRFNGFTEYMTPERGELVDVHYLDAPNETPYDFARMDPEDFAKKLSACFERGIVSRAIPRALRYDDNMTFYTTLFTSVAGAAHDPKGARPNQLGRSQAVDLLLSEYALYTPDDFLYRASEIGLIGRTAPIRTNLLRALHRELFENT